MAASGVAAIQVGNAMVTPTIYQPRLDRRRRLIAAFASVAVTALIAMAFASGWAPQVPDLVSSAMDVVSITASPTPEQAADLPKASAPRAAAAASPANRRARPKAVVAPPTPLPRPPRPAPPVAANGNASAAGSSTIVGPGTGAGGQGQGLGSGAGGSGDGGGGIRPTRRSGAITYRDYPDEARRLHAGGIVDVRLDIDASGRVTACRVIRSSGRADFDDTTCRLILQRFRFNPARNAAGEAVATVYGWRQRWWLDAEGMPPL